MAAAGKKKPLPSGGIIDVEAEFESRDCAPKEKKSGVGSRTRSRKASVVDDNISKEKSEEATEPAQKKRKKNTWYVHLGLAE